MFVPAVVMAMGLLPLMMKTGLHGTTVAVASAHSLISLPVIFLLLRSSLAQVDPDLEQAARGLGARPWVAFYRVTLPLIYPAVVAGMVIAFILSVNEVILAAVSDYHPRPDSPGGSVANGPRQGNAALGSGIVLDGGGNPCGNVDRREAAQAKLTWFCEGAFCPPR